MPILSYFAVVAPALAAFLWFLSSYLEPETPVTHQAAPASAALAPSPVRAEPASPIIGSAVSYRAPESEKQVEKSPPAEMIKSEAAAEPRKHAAQKLKQRKQFAHRRQRRETDEAANSDGNRYYADYQPFGSYRQW